MRRLRSDRFVACRRLPTADDNAHLSKSSNESWDHCLVAVLTLTRYY